MSGRFYAHSHGSAPEAWQPLADHLQAVGALAEQFGSRLGIGRAARLAGLLHDLGKYTRAFQKRLEGSEERVDHSTAGAAEVLRLAREGGRDDALMAQLIAYAIAGHHAGLPDRQGDGGTLDARLHEPRHTEPDEAWRQEIAPDLSALAPRLPGVRATSDTPHHKAIAKARASFQLSVLGRMIFSCLVDADYRDTEAYYARAEGRDVDRTWPMLGEVLPTLLARYDKHMAAMPSGNSSVNRLRAEILDTVRSNEALAPGLFTLTVPTGGGKTLASLGFALEHAQRHGLDRIIYAIPFTSIVDQTADVFRDVLGNDLILEHHSAIDDEKQGARDDQDAGRAKLRRAMEDWAAPIVVTTNVQLFEGLFAARPGRARKLHNIARSVIVLDEAQTLPRSLLIPTVWMIEALVRDWGCSIVLCTATQPALDRFGPDHPAALGIRARELAPEPSRLARDLRRVTLKRVGELDDATLIDELREVRQGLVIVNSRRHALELYRAAADAGLDGLIHLSTRQIAMDRRLLLQKVRVKLKGEQTCRVIATSLVEAGVDLDFPRVWRAEAGLDQIAQAAGRCNREGRRAVEDSIVTVFRAPDHPSPPELRGLAGDMERMAAEFTDLFAPEAMERYFREVYWRHGPDRLDRGRMDKLPICERFRVSANQTDFAYRSVAANYALIESGMLPVIVPRDAESEDAVHKLSVRTIPSGTLARRLQNYIVQVPPKARQLLMIAGHVRFAAQAERGDQFAVLVTPDKYNPEIGLIWENPQYLDIEGLFL